MATSSGGTLAGMAIANYLTGEKLRVHGFCVSDDSNYFYEHIEKALEAYHIRSTETRKICDIVDGYKGEGYAKLAISDQGVYYYLFIYLFIYLLIIIYPVINEGPVSLRNTYKGALQN